MTLDDYQQAAARTATRAEYPLWLNGSAPTWAEQEFDKLIFAIGLTGEAGEVVDYLKKVIGHGHTLDTDRLRSELGDVLWYVAALGRAYGLSLSEIATANVEKLRARYPDGFTTDRSVNRE